MSASRQKRQHEKMIEQTEDWYGDEDQTRQDLGITAATTDQELDRIEEVEEAYAEANDAILDGLHEYLGWLRDHAPAAETQKTIEGIARHHLGIETLETRHSDSLDFHEVAVWKLQTMLEAAFNAGKAAAREENDDE